MLSFCIVFLASQFSRHLLLINEWLLQHSYRYKSNYFHAIDTINSISMKPWRCFFTVFFFCTLELIGPTTLRNIYGRSRTEWELDNDSAIRRLDGIRFRTDRVYYLTIPYYKLKRNWFESNVNANVSFSFLSFSRFTLLT